MTAHVEVLLFMLNPLLVANQLVDLLLGVTLLLVHCLDGLKCLVAIFMQFLQLSAYILYLLVFHLTFTI
jgi:hypothetical protein